MFFVRGKRAILFGIAVLLLGVGLSACNLRDVFVSTGEELSRICAQDELVVNTTEDTNDAVCNDVSCSLREAVIQANNCDSDQTIVVPAGAYDLTRHGTDEDMARSGDLDITVPVTIRGEGDVIIDGQEAVRIFDIQTESFDDVVVLENLTIQDGRAESEGGAIYTLRADVRLVNSVVRNSQAGSPGNPGAGGGIYASNSLTLTNTEVSGNRVYGEGGGIFGGRAAVINMDSDSALVFNEALDGYSGGGIYSRGQATISGQVVRNRSTWAGGGIANAGRMEIDQAEIRDNITTDGVGGGLSNVNELRVEDSEILSNTAQEGGGLFAYVSPRFSDFPKTYLVDVRFSENEADQGGGALFNSADSLLVATRVEAGQSRAHRGGGVFNAGEAYLLGSTIQQNQALYGAGIWTNGDMSLSSSLIANNTLRSPSDPEVAVFGAALHVDSDGYLSMINTTISNNGEEGDGGSAIEVVGEIDADHVTIADNPTQGISGLIESIQDIDIRNSIVIRNGGGRRQCGRQLNSLGYNLFESTACGLHPDDIILEISGEEADLGPLADNGGGTMTHALFEGSPAVDAVLEGCPGPEVDQRGEPRPVGENCDIGAFEGEQERETRSAEIDINFNADRYTIEEGECTTLRWEVSGASSILLLGQEREATEAQEVCPDKTTGYTLFAETEADEAQSFLEIEVTEPKIDPGPQEGCFVNGVCTVPCPGDPQQYGGVCYE